MEENHSIDQSKSKQTTPLSSPDSIEEMLQLAFTSLGENRFDEAASIYQEILQVDPNNIYACFNLGMINHNNGNLTQAISCYQSVLAQESNNFQVLCHLANAYRDQGCWGNAVATYKQALAQDYDHADVHYHLGVVYYHQGNMESAQQCYEQALKIDKSHANAFYNLGLLHFEQGAYGLATNYYEQALVHRPKDIDTHYNLAVAMTKQGKMEAAASHYIKALELDHNDAELHNSLGNIFKQLKCLEKAEICYREAINLRPDYGAAHTNLAIVLHTIGEIDQAIECYSKAIELGHQTESADYMMAALTGSNRDSAPHTYVQDLFDSYADNFDNNLTNDLGYKSPDLLKVLATELLGANHQFRNVADLGCGTGLIGSRFRNISNYMIGIDLSGRMLEKADKKGVYDELHRCDIVEFLDDYDGDFDLLIAADVLIYLGDLVPFFKSVDSRVEPMGHLLFSVEKLTGQGNRQLQTSGRYAYSKKYILNLANTYGFSVETCSEIDLRKEKDQWIRGYLFALQKN